MPAVVCSGGMARVCLHTALCCKARRLGERVQDQPEEAASKGRLQRKIVSKLVATHRLNLWVGLVCHARVLVQWKGSLAWQDPKAVA